ncbi:leucine-rich alpha-2-glycoprotein [Heteronotia binoei]|uniref:leucine-rich alpha-2-glycoprotein n=1 Tax=Heteronotia binoei TaxID=13085 RepID=UPI00292DECA1|nr:leucine-rich alpha-2-glycoprotein [Heteronotia binoei]XP_060088657.1 leucine-rich alpha-2-glycoprotein [Heteronotia binoei]
MAYQVTALSLACMMTLLHGLQASLCPPLPMPNNATEFSCSSPSLQEFPTGFPNETLLISVEFTNISKIGADALVGLSKLQELHLSSNKLRSLPDGLFHDLPELATLDLTRNLLEDLPPGIFRNSSVLTQLSLHGNQLATLRPSWFHPLRHLAMLDLSHNQFTEVPPFCFSKLENLTDLDLSFNFLHTLTPQILEGLLHLEKLNLEGNQLQSIADGTFQRTPSLKFLFLRNNTLASLSAGIFEPLNLLELLDVSYNKLTSLVPKFSSQAMKLSLDLSGNPWACKCHMSALVAWLKEHSIFLWAEQQTICATPKYLEGQMITSLAPGKFGAC